jgi:hypothetical protein
MRSFRSAVISTLLLVLSLAHGAGAQGVGINSTGAAADTSALLDLKSTSKGLLPPRMTAAQRTAIVLPATGLVVYQTDGAPGVWINEGTPVAPNWKLLIDNTSVPNNPWLSNGSNLYYTNGNVGVGNTSPTSRLSIEDPLNGLRVQTDQTGSSLASFGGTGTFFVDAPFVTGGRLAILENGNVGLGVTSPAAHLDVLGGNYDVTGTEGDFRVGNPSYRIKMGVALAGGGAGDARIMQQGQPGGYNVLSLGAAGNRLMYMNGNTQRIGIGTDSPTAPLGFTASLGHKITLYPGATGDAGFGIAGNRLQIYADNPNADVAMGYDAAGTFNERLAVKPTGALAVSGNTGATGQVLYSNGSASSATWGSPTNAVYNSAQQGVCVFGLTLSSASPETAIPNLSLSISPTAPTRVLIVGTIPVLAVPCSLCGASEARVELKIDGTLYNQYDVSLANGAYGIITINYLASVSAGAHTITAYALWPIGPNVEYGADNQLQGTLIALQFPQ